MAKRSAAMPKPAKSTKREPTAAESTTGLTSGASYFDTVARMIAEVADGLDYAHKNGVIHRDMKPSNLMLAPDGRVSINDFGLARMLEQPGMTMTGEFMGSPLYMSPEQMMAGRMPLDHRTDIYSLGATLYELLTLQPPFPGETRERIIAQIMTKEPVSLRKVNKRVPLDLETICLKALEKDADRRYATAAELADDLRRYVNRFAISARRTGVVGRTVKWARRNRAVAALGVCVLVAGLAAGLFAWRASLEQQRRVAQVAQLRRESAMDTALAAAMSGQLVQAEQAIAEAQLHGASVAWVRMLEGQVALFHGRSAEAIQHLERAVDLQPDSVAARCMLASAYHNNGQWGEFLRRVAEVDEATPVTAEDFLFKGRMLLWPAPREALKMLDRAVELRPASPVCGMFRARARAFLALDTGDPVMATSALDEARAAQNYLKGNPIASATTLYTRLVAAVLDPETTEQRLQEAEVDVRHLEQFPGYVPGRFWRAHYFLLRNDPDSAAQVSERDPKVGVSGFDAFVYTESAFRTQRFEAALATLNRVPEPRDPVVEWMRAYLLLEIPGGRDGAEAIYQALRRRGDWTELLETINVSLRLGRPEEEQKVALEQLASVPTTKHWEFYEHVYRYVGSGINENELLRFAGSSARNQLMAHWYIGMRKLSRGDRDGARRSFQQAVDTRVFHWGPVALCRAFLARMDQDPAWPNSTPSAPATQPASAPATEARP